MKLKRRLSGYQTFSLNNGFLELKTFYCLCQVIKHTYKIPKIEYCFKSLKLFFLGCK